jgi:hypothetical protein
VPLSYGRKKGDASFGDDGTSLSLEDDFEFLTSSVMTLVRKLPVITVSACALASDIAIRSSYYRYCSCLTPVRDTGNALIPLLI